MKPRLSRLLRWSKLSPKNPLDLMAMSGVLALSVVGFWVNVDLYMKLAGSLASFLAVFVGVKYISKFSVPQAFAVGYFKSFVEPVNEALRIGLGYIEYEEGSGNKARISLDHNTVDAKLAIVMPQDLSVVSNSSGNGLSDIQTSLSANTEGNIHLPASKSGRSRGFTVHFERDHTSETQSITIMDVPNILTPLRDIQFEEVSDESAREKRAQQSLKESYNELRKNIDRHQLEKEKVIIRQF